MVSVYELERDIIELERIAADLEQEAAGLSGGDVTFSRGSDRRRMGTAHDKSRRKSDGSR